LFKTSTILKIVASLHKALKEKCVMSETLDTKLFKVGVSEISAAMAKIQKSD